MTSPGSRRARSPAELRIWCKATHGGARALDRLAPRRDRDQAASAELILVENFFEELKAKVGN